MKPQRLVARLEPTVGNRPLVPVLWLASPVGGVRPDLLGPRRTACAPPRGRPPRQARRRRHPPRRLRQYRRQTRPAVVAAPVRHPAVAALTRMPFETPKGFRKGFAKGFAKGFERVSGTV